MPKVTHLLYLHGFRSCPLSTKARQMAAHVAQHHPAVTWWCPQLPPSPREAMAMLAAGVATWPRTSMAVVGSSLGGFYAMHAAERFGCKAALLNPAVQPARDLAKYIGEQTQFHSPEERFYFRADYVQELRELECGPLQAPRRIMAVIAKGDEVLDWREMHARYATSNLLLLENSDHAISDFASHLPQVLRFLDLA